MRHTNVKYKKIKDIKKAYESGVNIMQFLRSLGGTAENQEQNIRISYDLQSGNYIKKFLINRDFKEQYGKKLASTIASLGKFNTILEAGTGEGIMLHLLRKHLAAPCLELMGFDISWSRLKYARYLFERFAQQDISLFSANLFNIPLEDNSVDIVFTSHAIEPNGGKEAEALKELYRVASKYLVLLEPSFDFASEDGKKRMLEHGFITGLHQAAVALGYKIHTYEPFGLSVNELNPTGLLIIEKQATSNNSSTSYRCPITSEPLSMTNEPFLSSAESGFAYPILQGIPCLCEDNAVLATHLFDNPDECFSDITFE
jgi:ubiquinone/menaquinone biosynthesis C-methylase UbiE